MDTERLDPPFLAGACPTTKLCVLQDGQFRIDTTTDPSAGPWSKGPPGFDVSGSIACPAASLCLAAGVAHLNFSTDPASGQWSARTLAYLASIACSSNSLCAGIDGGPQVLSTTDPAGGAWTSATVEPDPCRSAPSCTVERIESSDRSSLRVVDQSETPGGGPFLTGLTLNGNTLSWSHGGSNAMVDLTPP